MSTQTHSALIYNARAIVSNYRCSTFDFHDYNPYLIASNNGVLEMKDNANSKDITDTASLSTAAASAVRHPKAVFRFCLKITREIIGRIFIYGI